MDSESVERLSVIETERNISFVVAATIIVMLARYMRATLITIRMETKVYLVPLASLACIACCEVGVDPG